MDAGRFTLRDAEIRAVRSGGRRLVGRRMVLYVAPVPGTRRAAFVAGRRVGTAVDRNRARRVLREAWRGVRGSIPPGTGVVIVARRAVLPARTQELETEMRQLLSSVAVGG